MSQDNASTMIHVVVAIVFNAEREVLIAQRPEGKPYAGYWEFPGGKVEVGESEEQALVRELYEELGIDLQGCTFTHFMRGSRDDILLDFYTTTPQIKLYPQGLEGQAWRWVKLSSLDATLFPAPNAQVIAALQNTY